MKDATPELAKALAKAQAQFPTIERTRTVRVKTKTGGEYSFSYAPLDTIREAVKPACSENGLSVLQLLTTSLDGKPALRTMLLHESGESIDSIFPLPANGHLDAQGWGSLITYFRRYALTALLGIATEEDDDGNSASGNTISGGQEAGAARASVADTTKPRTGSSPSPENPAEKAQAAQQQNRVIPEDDGHPANVVVHWGGGKFDYKGQRLGDLPESALKFLAEKWDPDNNPKYPAKPEDRRLKAAAQALLAGESEVPPLSASDDDIPF